MMAANWRLLCQFTIIINVDGVNRDIFMNKGTIIRLSFLLLVTSAFALQGCGGGGDGGDFDSLPISGISSKTWMAWNCIKDNDIGDFYKTLFEFKSNGEIFFGYQYFQDTSCITPSDRMALPFKKLKATYINGANEMLQDGANGNLITIDYNKGSDPVGGAYTITNENTLCFTSNLKVQTGPLVDDLITNDNTSSSPIDYEHCLTAHSKANNPSVAPPADPGPGTDSNNEGSIIYCDAWYCYPLPL
jgi:hypothetical protein